MDATIDLTKETAVTGSALPYNDVVPGAVQEVTQNGLVVAPDKLVALATYLRDKESYDYLSMVTSVDWPDYFEVVYYLYGVTRAEEQPGAEGTADG